VPPARTGPIRNPLSPPPGIFGGAVADGGSNGRPGTKPPYDVGGIVENGVRTAYQVIEEYMRRGYEAANGNQNHQERRGPMDEKRANFYGMQNPWGAMQPFTEQWLMAMRAWTNAWASFIPGGWPQQQAWNPAGTSHANSEAMPAVSVQLTSRRPAEVITNLRPGADGMDLGVDPLYHDAGSSARIEQLRVSITRVPGRVRVSVSVDADQPAGRYYGAIRNLADRSIVGDLSVVISESYEE
jgi:hypothetical protein